MVKHIKSYLELVTVDEAAQKAIDNADLEVSMNGQGFNNIN